MARDNEGFTLLELMITVALIAIILAAAIPNLAAARRSSNEAAAIGNLKAIASMMEQFRTRFGGYPSNWTVIRSSGYLEGFNGEVKPVYDGASNVAGKNGYSFVISSISGIPWRVFAVCNELGTTGNRNFYTDATGILTHDSPGLATPSSPPVD